MKTTSAPPRALALLESLRGMGYSTATAIADVVDNSVTAGASKVRVDFGWSGSGSFIRISDNGRGLSADALRDAMVLGVHGPSLSRAVGDLGRFGMGMKTASLSQCKRLTVASKAQKDTTAYCCWDIDFLSADPQRGWDLLLEPFPSAEALCEATLSDGYSTVVLWENLDRVLSDGFGRDHFLDLIDEVELHLGMTFHRFLEDASKSLSIFINGEEQSHRVKPWDPFMRAHDSTFATPVETFADSIQVQGYVLPHKDKLSEKAFKLGGGAGGWAAQQGFYVYRGRRLLVAGSWLGLGDGRPWIKDDLNRLARIRLDLPNHLDEKWHIDIRKAKARPPASIAPRLADLARVVRSDARRVLTHRGETTRDPNSGNKPFSAWRVSDTASSRRYRVDETHPVISRLLGDAGAFAGRLRQALRVIEETVPIERIWLDATERVDTRAEPSDFVVPEDLLEIMRDHYFELVRSRGMSPSAAKAQLTRIAPFHRFPAAISSLGEGQGEG